MANAPFASFISIFFLLLFFFNQTSSTRTLGHPTPSPHHHHHHGHPKISFLMKDMLNAATHQSTSSTKPATTKVTGRLPFPKPIGLFPPIGAIPIPESNPTVQGTGFSSAQQTLDISNFGSYFPARAALQELELGAVTVIDEEFFNGSSDGLPLGKAQGVYVASSEDGSSHMMAMTAFFTDGEFKDGLRFFGVRRKDAAELNIAVIGGSGKYVDANGYATVKAEEQEANKLLLFNVYLS